MIDEYSPIVIVLVNSISQKMSFTRKISQKNNNELTKVADTAFIPDGVYILHDILGARTVDGWKPKDNEGVTGILLVEDDHKIVVALENAPEKLLWSKNYGLINEPIKELEDAKSDFNGEYYCRNLNSPDYPAAYYCLNYKKGGRKWYLPSSGELWLIRNHIEEIQSALEAVGGEKLYESLLYESLWVVGVPMYWSSTEWTDFGAWDLDLEDRHLTKWNNKVDLHKKVRPVSNFNI